ncbi:hypothetical protein A3709_19115 [Halioglobus sp. HI00S01]|nr:hypothetical protein A3709_19115 [Halioglobus sp. HI00S01]
MREIKKRIFDTVMLIELFLARDVAIRKTCVRERVPYQLKGAYNQLAAGFGSVTVSRKNSVSIAVIFKIGKCF